MARLDLSKGTTTNFTSNVPNFIVDAKSMDVDNANGDTTYYFSDATTNLGYALQIPEIFSSASSLCTWAFGKGFETDPRTKAELDHVTGRGNETFLQLMWNHGFMKLIIGDAFMHIIWNKTKNIILNLIPISAERVRVISNSGRIKRYEVWTGKKWEVIKTEDMYHSSNKRIGDQIHGTCQIDAIRDAIDTRNEACEDERTIKHRDKALGIAYYKTDSAGKISYVNSQIEKAVKNGEMLGLPEEAVKIEPYPSRSSEDRQSWIQYWENFIYQTFGVPRSIATSDGTSEVGGINGHLIFEPIYGKEQLDEEDNIWSQLHRKIKFNRPPSLAPKAQDDSNKNTGQTSIQPAETEPMLNR